ncbi:IS630 family transposase, partial [Candidatus Acetothermia bacterium]|nr:IS630 family transposase [Candidatus Acetothermia bacterium]
FVDAAHVVHNVLPGYGWAPIGERPVFPSNSGRERLSLLGAYCPLDEEWVNNDTSGTINAQSVVELTDRLCDLHPQARRIVLIVDNARYNHAKLVREHVVGTRIEIIYLPPYSPNLNLVERMWRFMKKKVMRNQFYKTFAAFVAAIKYFFTHL